MINTLSDLIAMTHREAAENENGEFPSLAEELRLITPGCTAEEIANLRKAFPGLPESYLEVAAAISLPRKSIGHFELATGGRREGSLGDFLKRANSPEFPLWPIVAKVHFYFIAGFFRHLICVRRKGLDGAGEVFMIVLSQPPSFRVVPFADSFEQVLIGFGRVRELWRADRVGNEGVAAFVDSMQRDFRLSDVQSQLWRIIASYELWSPDAVYGQEIIAELQYMFPPMRRPLPVGRIHLEHAQALGLVEAEQPVPNRPEKGFVARLSKLLTR